MPSPVLSGTCYAGSLAGRDGKQCAIKCFLAERIRSPRLKSDESR
jgi:hypothetical protein